MTQLDTNRVLELAAHIERGGHWFFKQVAGKFEDPEIAGLFSYLAEEELKHLDTFEQLKDTARSFPPPKAPAGEYTGYVDSLLKDQAPDTGRLFEAKLDRIHTMEDATDFAVDFENQTIVFFYSLKQLTHPSAHDIIDEVIKEEYSHITRIFDFRRSRIQVLRET